MIIGFPTDEGVRRNGGRVGAAGGPAAIREALFRLTPDPRPTNQKAFADMIRRVVDLGDLETSGNLDSDQQRLGNALAPWLKRGVIPIVLGGGHETTFGHFLGYVGAESSVNILNFDGHPDVRPVLKSGGHSGSPFRQALTHDSGLCASYAVAGLQPHATAPAHRRYLDELSVRYIWRDKLDFESVQNLIVELPSPGLVSMDTDALDQSIAPGVSAPNANGLPMVYWLRICRLAGRNPAVRSIDFVEFNPRFDADGRTARVGALHLGVHRGSI